jgi:hypothetical protein
VRDLVLSPILTIARLFTLVPILGAFFTGFAGTLMQMMGVYQNCRCSIPFWQWFNPSTNEGVWVNLAWDTQKAREMSDKYWRPCGYIAIGFMSAVCYVGWWYQRYLRGHFEQRVWELERIPGNRPETTENSGPTTVQSSRDGENVLLNS